LKHQKMGHIPSKQWNQGKYEKVCLIIHNEVGHGFIQGWNSAS
jgi:hypothetical protein